VGRGGGGGGRGVMADREGKVTDGAPGPTARPESLRRELYAILFLYAVLTVLPVAIGWLFQPTTG